MAGGARKSWVDFHKGKETLVIAEDRIATEILSVAAFMGVSHVLDHHLELAPVKRVMAKAIKPFLGTADMIMDNLPALESDEETAERKAMNDDERAYHYADMTFDTGVSFAASLALQSFLQDKIDNYRGVGYKPEPTGNFFHDNFVNPYNRAVTFDKISSAAMGGLMNTMLAKENEAMQDSLQSVLEKAGMDKEVANDKAKAAVNLAIPNAVGMVVATALLSHGYKNRPQPQMA